MFYDVLRKGIDSGAMRAAIESHRDFSAFDFQPVFPCSLRSPTGIAHSLRPRREAGHTLFPRWRVSAPRFSCLHFAGASCRWALQESRRGNSRARGSPRAGSHSGHRCPPQGCQNYFSQAAKIIFSDRQRPLERTTAGNKKARDCGHSAVRAPSGHTTGDGYNMQNQRHAVKGINPVREIKSQVPARIRIT
jgi:hypothetical protein